MWFKILFRIKKKIKVVLHILFKKTFIAILNRREEQWFEVSNIVEYVQLTDYCSLQLKLSDSKMSKIDKNNFLSFRVRR